MPAALTDPPEPHRAPDIVTVVDDDPALLNALKFSFEVEGYTVRAFPTAEALLAESEFPIRGALVIDYRLPGIDGLELLSRLRKRGVTAPAVLITTPDFTVVRKAASAKVPVVEKPLVASALLDAVHGLLTQAP